jgi:ABC-type multidrug transport system fused ATPase/permease subunit
VDAKSDQVVQESIQTGFQHSTIFIIAHRLHTIIGCDVIAVMERGELKEFAPPATLLAKETGIFKSMWEMENH